MTYHALHRDARLLTYQALNHACGFLVFLVTTGEYLSRKRTCLFVQFPCQANISILVPIRSLGLCRHPLLLSGPVTMSYASPFDCQGMHWPVLAAFRGLGMLQLL